MIGDHWTTDFYSVHRCAPHKYMLSSTRTRHASRARPPEMGEERRNLRSDEPLRTLQSHVPTIADHILPHPRWRAGLGRVQMRGTDRVGVGAGVAHSDRHVVALLCTHGAHGGQGRSRLPRTTLAAWHTFPLKHTPLKAKHSSMQWAVERRALQLTSAHWKPAAELEEVGVESTLGQGAPSRGTGGE